LSAGDGVRAVAEQLKGPTAPRVRDAPRHDGDIAPEVGGDLRGEQPAGTSSRVDDHDQARERGDDALARDE